MYQRCLYESSCRIGSVEPASLNLVSGRFVPLFCNEDFKYTFIFPRTTVSRVMLNISQVVFNNIYETFALHQRTKCFNLFVHVNHYKCQ